MPMEAHTSVYTASAPRSASAMSVVMVTVEPAALAFSFALET